jgi:hypothetical protein
MANSFDRKVSQVRGEVTGAVHGWLERSYEQLDSSKRGLGLIPVRRMLAVGEHQYFREWQFCLNRGDLLRRAVFIILALYHEHRATDRMQVRFDVPRPETRVEPDIVPAPKS